MKQISLLLVLAFSCGAPGSTGNTNSNSNGALTCFSDFDCTHNFTCTFGTCVSGTHSVSDAGFGGGTEATGGGSNAGGGSFNSGGGSQATGGGAGGGATTSLHWSNMNRVPTQGSQLWGSSPTDVWLVGENGSLEHFDGNAWSAVVSPTPNTLADIFGTSATDIWAVGERTAIHFNGTQWRVVTMPTSTGNFECVWASGANDVYIGTDDGELLHFNGTTWSLINTGISSYGIFGLSGTGPNDVWASRYSSTPMHWNGTTWAVAGSIYPNADLRAIHAIAPNDVWLAGSGIRHWNGSTWTAFSSDSYYVTSIWAAGPNDVWFGGGYNNGSGKIWHYNGRTVTSETFEALPAMLVSAFGFGTEPWFASFDSLMRRDGTRWVNTRADDTLNGAWVGSPQRAVFVGALGRILEWDGARLVTRASSTTASLTSVWGPHFDDLWAVGAGGTLIHKQNNEWRPVASPSQQNLSSVWGSASNDIWAIGPTGPFLHFNGTSWSNLQRPSDNAYHQLIGFSANDVWAVASDTSGNLAHWNGSAWSVQTIAAGVRFMAIAGTSGSNLWFGASQSSGYIAFQYWNGAQLSNVGSSTYAPTAALWASPTGDVWASAGSLKLMHIAGQQSALPYTLPMQTFINAIAGSASNDVWAVGTGGLVLHATP